MSRSNLVQTLSNSKLEFINKNIDLIKYLLQKINKYFCCYFIGLKTQGFTTELIIINEKYLFSFRYEPLILN